MDKQDQMDSSKPDKLYLKSTSTVSLHSRFSKVLKNQQTSSKTKDVLSLKDKSRSKATKLARPLKRSRPSFISLRAPALGMRVSHSIWTRHGWQRLTRYLAKSRPSGFWSFRNKYSWRTRSVRKIDKQQVQSYTPIRYSRAPVPTRKELDRELDRYMSTTKSKLDRDIEDYMSMSRSRLDAEIDDYMMMAGQPKWD